MAESKVKSNAPWILGIIGIFFTIMHYACAVVCSAAIAAGKETFGGADAVSAQQTMDNGVFVTYLGVGMMSFCFVLSFFGKSKESMLTGVIMILAGIGAASVSILHVSVAGIVAGIIYMCAGISSCCNAKKIKA